MELELSVSFLMLVGQPSLVPEGAWETVPEGIFAGWLDLILSVSLIWIVFLCFNPAVRSSKIWNRKSLGKQLFFWLLGPLEYVLFMSMLCS